ncbi:MAG: RAD55 family ATPase [Halobacteriales archaeon]
MYALPIPPSPEVEPGTNLLVRGPPMTGKARLARRVVAAGLGRGEYAVVVTADDGAGRVLRDDRFRDAAARVRVVDAISQQQGEPAGERPNVECVPSPADLTGIGMALSGALEAVAGAGAVSVLFESLSTLLAYRDVETVFRFLHVTTGRVSSVDGLGLFLAHTGAGDKEDLAKLATLFDGVVETRDDGAEPQYRLRGVGADAGGWRPLASLETPEPAGEESD